MVPLGKFGRQGSGFDDLGQNLENRPDFGSVLVVLGENIEDEAEFPPLAPQFGSVLEVLGKICEDKAQFAAKSSSFDQIEPNRAEEAQNTPNRAH